MPTYAVDDGGGLGEALDEDDPRVRRVRQLRNLSVHEVSLVDTPANQHAHILIAKRDRDAEAEHLREATALLATMVRKARAELDAAPAKAVALAKVHGAAVTPAGAADLERLARGHVGAVALDAPPASGSLRAAVRERHAPRPEPGSVAKAAASPLVQAARGFTAGAPEPVEKRDGAPPKGTRARRDWDALTAEGRRHRARTGHQSAQDRLRAARERARKRPA